MSEARRSNFIRFPSLFEKEIETHNERETECARETREKNTINTVHTQEWLLAGSISTCSYSLSFATQSLALWLNFVCCNCCLGLLSLCFAEWIFFFNVFFFQYLFLLSSFSFQVALCSVCMFFFSSSCCWLYFFFSPFRFVQNCFVFRTSRIHTQNAFIHNIFFFYASYKRNDKYSARVPLKNRFSSLWFCLFSFFFFL